MGKTHLETMAPVCVMILVVYLSGGASGCCVLYPYGAGEGDSEATTGDDGYVAYFDDTFVYYGATYSRMYANINTPFSFDESFSDYSESPFPDSDAPFLTGWWEDILLSNRLGAVYYRQSTADEDLDRAAEDLARVGSSSIVDSIIVVTWDSVQIFGGSDPDLPQNFFQQVLILAHDSSDNPEMYSVFNYCTIIWGLTTAVAAFNKGDGVHIVNLSTSQNTKKAPYCTNVDVPGRVVVRVDQDPIIEPVLTCPEDFCSFTTNRIVTMYDGTIVDNGIPNQEGKHLFTKSNTSDTDPCKFSVKAVINSESDPDWVGDIDWAAINVGVHTNTNRHRRSYAFNKVLGLVQERGEAIKPNIISTDSTPYLWDDGTTFISISGDEVCGWTLESTGGCGYKFTYSPNTPEPVFRAFMPTPKPATEGPCG